MRVKNGAAHFEMIISFVLFAGIVTFLFLFISPYQTNTIQTNLLEDVYLSFEEHASTNLTKISVGTDFTESGCFSFSIPDDILSYELTETVAFSPTREKRRAGISGNEMSIEGNDKFFEVLISPVFSSDSLSGCKRIDDFTLGSIVEKPILAYPEILKIQEEYKSDYINLRGKLSVPPTYDFAITSSELGIDMQTEIPAEVEVLSKNYIDEVLYENGTIINAEFVIKVW